MNTTVWRCLWRSTWLGTVLTAAGLGQTACRGQSALDDAQRPLPAVQTISQTAARFLQDPALPPGLRAEPTRARWEQPVVVVPVAGPPGHDATAAIVQLEPAGDRVAAFRAPRPGQMAVTRRPAAEARAVVEPFVLRHLPEAAANGRTMEVVQYTRDVDPAGMYRFQIVVREGAAAVGVVGADVGVQAWDCRIGEAIFLFKPVTVATTPTIQQAQAVAWARGAVDRHGQRSAHVLGTTLEVNEWPDWREQRLFYRVRLVLDGPRPRPDWQPGATVYVNALSGKVFSVSEDPVADEAIARAKAGPPYQYGDHPAVAADAWPAWLATDQEPLIVFSSCRSTPGRPVWAGVPETLFAVPARRGSPTCLLPDAGGGTRWLSTPTAGGRHVAGLCKTAEIMVLDRLTGTVRTVTTEQRPGWQPALSGDGRWLTWAALRRHGDQDLWLLDLDTPQAAQLRLLRLDGADSQPVFDSRTKRVFFAHHPPTAPAGQAWQIRSVRYDVTQTQSEAPLLVEGCGTIERLSIFPDGQRLLVYHGGRTEIIRFDHGQRTPVPLDALPDPDDPEHRPLRIRHPVIGPDGETIAFAGLHGDPKLGPWGWFIYTCRLDGSDLRRVTPLEDVVLQPYVPPAAPARATP